MTYTPPSAIGYAQSRGSADEKLTGELGKIGNELGTLTTTTGTCLKCATVALAAGNANAFCMAWLNPVAGAIVIHKLSVIVTTPGGTVGSVGDFGVGATGTTHADNLLDAIGLNAGANYDNITDKGVNGKTVAIAAQGEYITGQILTQNAAALAGKAVILYSPY